MLIAEARRALAGFRSVNSVLDPTLAKYWQEGLDKIALFRPGGIADDVVQNEQPDQVYHAGLIEDLIAFFENMPPNKFDFEPVVAELQRMRRENGPIEAEQITRDALVEMAVAIHTKLAEPAGPVDRAALQRLITTNLIADPELVQNPYLYEFLIVTLGDVRAGRITARLGVESKADPAALAVLRRAMTPLLHHIGGTGLSPDMFGALISRILLETAQDIVIRERVSDVPTVVPAFIPSRTLVPATAASLYQQHVAARFGVRGQAPTGRLNVKNLLAVAAAAAGVFSRTTHRVIASVTGTVNDTVQQTAESFSPPLPSAPPPPAPGAPPSPPPSASSTADLRAYYDEYFNWMPSAAAAIMSNIMANPDLQTAVGAAIVTTTGWQAYSDNLSLTSIAPVLATVAASAHPDLDIRGQLGSTASDTLMMMSASLLIAAAIINVLAGFSTVFAQKLSGKMSALELFIARHAPSPSYVLGMGALGYIARAKNPDDFSPVAEQFENNFIAVNMGLAAVANLALVYRGARVFRGPGLRLEWWLPVLASVGVIFGGYALFGNGMQERRSSAFRTAVAVVGSAALLMQAADDLAALMANNAPAHVYGLLALVVGSSAFDFMPRAITQYTDLIVGPIESAILSLTAMKDLTLTRDGDRVVAFVDGEVFHVVEAPRELVEEVEHRLGISLSVTPQA